MNASLDRFQGTLEMKVHVGDDRHADLVDDFGQRLGVLPLRHRHTDELGPGRGELVDLGHARVDVIGVAGRHRLDGDRGVAADLDVAVLVGAEGDLPGLASRDHGYSRAANMRSDEAL